MAEENNTNQGNALAPTINSERRHPLFPSQEEWKMMQFMAQTFHAAGVMPSGIDSVQKLVVVLQAGLDTGLTPIEAMNSFYFVNGKVTIYGEMKIALVRRAGHKVTWGECDAMKASVTITRDDTKESMSASLTLEEAKKRNMHMGRNGVKDPWIKYPENMLKYKVFDMVSKFLCPDALHGVQTEDEVEPREPISAKEVEVPLENRPGENGEGVIDITPPLSLAEALKKPEEKSTPVPAKKRAKKAVAVAVSEETNGTTA